MTDHKQPAAGVALKPCPMCGGEAEACRNDHEEPVWSVECCVCTASVRIEHGSKAQAIAAWNTRAPTDAGGAVSEAARERIEQIIRPMVRSVAANSIFTTPEREEYTRRKVDELLAALTPAPQAEGSPCHHEPYQGACVHCGVPFVNGRPRYPAPQPLQQGGEVTRQAGEKANAIMNSFHPQWSKDHEGEAALGWFMDTVASIAADRDKAVGLWTWFASRTDLELSYSYGDEDEEGRGWQVHRVSGGRSDREWTRLALAETPGAAVEAARAFLSSQTEGR